MQNELEPKNPALIPEHLLHQVSLLNDIVKDLRDTIKHQDKRLEELRRINHRQVIRLRRQL